MRPTANIILNRQKLKSFPLRSGTKQGYLLSLLPFNIVSKVLATAIRQEKEIKGIQIGKVEGKVSLFADDIIVYLESTIDYTHTHTHTTTWPNKWTSQNNSIQRQYWRHFLYINSKMWETEIRKKISFDIATRKMKYLVKILTSW